MKTAIIIAIIFLYSFFLALLFKEKPNHIPFLCDNILKEIRDEQIEFERKMREIRLEKEQNRELEDISFVGMYALKKEYMVYANLDKMITVEKYLGSDFYLCQSHLIPQYYEIITLQELSDYIFFKKENHMIEGIDYFARKEKIEREEFFRKEKEKEEREEKGVL